MNSQPISSKLPLDRENRKKLWQYYQKYHRKRKQDLIPDLVRDLPSGWLLPYLTQIDSLLWGRWQYWSRCQMLPKSAWMRWKMESAIALIEGRKPENLPLFVIEQTLPEEPIPQIEWQYSSEAEAMLRDTLDCIPSHGGWCGWSSWEYIRYFLDWVLYGLGHPAYRTLPKEPSGCEGASIRLYQMFDVSLLLMFPEDYLGRILPEICSKQGQRNQGFFPTPLTLSSTIAQMINDKGDLTSKQNRILTVNEPAVGTGSMLLAQSNYTLCAIGQDIDATLLQSALFQFALYSPWYYCPIWWLGHTDLILGNSLTMENLTSVNAKYWVKEFFENSEDKDSDKDLDRYIQQIQQNKNTPATKLPSYSVADDLLKGNKKAKKKSQFAKPFQQLSLFDLEDL
ncbi:MAG: hypothetical protein ACRC2V_15785 [Xenococcaceae cyanobacterium]